MMKKIKWGIIGAGGIARRKTIPGMLKAQNCQLTAVMDVVGAMDIGREFGVKAHQTEKELLSDPEVEAVYIASPVSLHHDQIISAARAGKHILCEKPLTMNLASGRSAISICEKHRVFFQEGYMMKFHGAHTAIRDLIQKGRLGKIVSMRAQLSCWYPPIPGAWRQDPSKGGGGALIDMATHLYDLLEYFAGSIRRVGVLTGNQVHSYASEDSATTILEFASGAHATVDSFFCIPDAAVPTRLEIYGSHGSILTEGTIGQSVSGSMRGIFDIGRGGYDAVQNKDAIRSISDISFDQINPYTAECEYFANCILEKRPPEINSGANALHMMQLIETAYRSAKTHQILEVK